MRSYGRSLDMNMNLMHFELVSDGLTIKDMWTNKKSAKRAFRKYVKRHPERNVLLMVSRVWPSIWKGKAVMSTYDWI